MSAKIIGRLGSPNGAVHLRKCIGCSNVVSANPENRIARMYTFELWEKNVPREDLPGLVQKHFGDKYDARELARVAMEEKKFKIQQLARWNYMLMCGAMGLVTVIGPEIGPHGIDEVLAFWIPESLNMTLLQAEISNWEHGFAPPCDA